LLALKRRPAHKGLILIAGSISPSSVFLQPLTPADQGRLAPLGRAVYLADSRPATTPRWLRGQHDTLAVRVTAHPLAAALCRACGHPLVSTSANLSGRPPARSALAVRRQLGRHLDTCCPARPAARP
jgi:L-threonylcarbamoyladenylate synthase